MFGKDLKSSSAKGAAPNKFMEEVEVCGEFELTAYLHPVDV